MMCDCGTMFCSHDQFYVSKTKSDTVRQMMYRPLSNEQLYQLREDLRRVQEPFIQLLVDLYSVSIPTITIADGVVETTYSQDVERQANKILREMAETMVMAARYKPGR